MQIIDKVKFFSFLFIVFLFNICCCSIVCLAGSVDYYGGQGFTTGGASNGFGSNSFQGYLGYRITLVDKDGNKYPGTRSVDFTYSATSLDDAIVVYEYNPGNLFYSNYRYRFGENDANSYIRVGTSIIPFAGNKYDPSSHVAFVNTYIENYQNNAIFCPSAWRSKAECNNKIDFNSLFLYYANYFKVKGTNPKKLDSVFLEDPDLKNYFFSVELLVAGDWSYGTSTEMLQYMYDASNYYARQYRDNIAVEKLNFACGLFTTQSFKDKYSDFSRFDTYFSDFNDCIRKSLVGEGKNILWTGNGCVTNYTSYAYGIPGLYCGVQNWGGGAHIDNLRNFNETVNRYASGVAMISLNFENLPTQLNSELKLCSNNSVSINIRPIAESIIKTDLFKVNSSVDDNQALYCYDNVTFNYNNLLDPEKGIAGDKLYNTILEESKIPPIVATVKRFCYGNTDGVNILNEVKENYNNSIFVNAYGENFEFKPDIDNIKYQNNQYTIQFKFHHSITYKGSFDYNTVQKGFIVFPNYKEMLGKSSNFVKNILNYDNSQCDPTIFKRSDNTNCFNVDNKYYGLRFINNSSSENDLNCEFNYNVKKDDENIASDTKYKFRVISLENPFPARDGSSRLPGMNWLNSKENNVFEYIVNNRGIRYITKSNNVSPEEMYNKVKPMYTVTLTPSTMIKIRNYNKKYAYDSMYQSMSADVTSHGAYKLECNYHDLGNGDIGNGRECYSTFLREYINDSMDGVCYLSPSELNKDVTKYYDNLKPLMNILDGSNSLINLGYDMNKNYRNDLQDLYILQPDNRGKNIQYYTCANKTFLSGGPIEGGK